MSTFAQLTYHIVFATKHRYPLIHSEFKDHLYSYIAGIIRMQKGHPIEIGGVEDHVHILASLPTSKAISEAVQEIKARSSKWSNDEKDRKEAFAWQKGYGIFSVSYSQIESVSQYIQNQVEHHRSKTFEEEYATFLRKHQISFKPKWLFEGEFSG